MQTLATIETKLLYTLHWIILDASDECAEADYENGVFYSNPFHYLFTIPAMTVSIYVIYYLKTLTIFFIHGINKWVFLKHK